LTVKQKVGDNSKFDNSNLNNNVMDSPLDLKRLKVKEKELSSLPVPTSEKDRKVEGQEAEETDKKVTEPQQLYDQDRPEFPLVEEEEK
jgi:predicted AlkP superfamily phosphohydrolase/phosphomutase